MAFPAVAEKYLRESAWGVARVKGGEGKGGWCHKATVGQRTLLPWAYFLQPRAGVCCSGELFRTPKKIGGGVFLRVCGPLASHPHRNTSTLPKLMAGLAYVKKRPAESVSHETKFVCP